MLLAAIVMIVPMPSNASGPFGTTNASVKQSSDDEVKQFVKVNAVGIVKAEVNTFVIPISEMKIGDTSITELTDTTDTSYTYTLDANGMSFGLNFGNKELEKQFLGLSNKTVEIRGSLIPAQTSTNGAVIRSRTTILVESFMEIVR